jgi:hypothetical protein
MACDLSLGLKCLLMSGVRDCAHQGRAQRARCVPPIASRTEAVLDPHRDSPPTSSTSRRRRAPPPPPTAGEVLVVALRPAAAAEA